MSLMPLHVGTAIFPELFFPLGCLPMAPLLLLESVAFALLKPIRGSSSIQICLNHELHQHKIIFTLISFCPFCPKSQSVKVETQPATDLSEPPSAKTEIIPRAIQGTVVPSVLCHFAFTMTIKKRKRAMKATVGALSYSCKCDKENT